jgi:hypothetical protein
VCTIDGAAHMPEIMQQHGWSLNEAALASAVRALI